MMRVRFESPYPLTIFSPTIDLSIEMKVEPFTPLQTPRLLLRRLTRGDAAALCAYRNLPEVARYQSWETFETDDAIRLIEKNTAVEPGLPYTWFQLGIIEQKSGRLAGDCGLHCLGDDTQLMELGITLAPEAQGKGYAAEALSAAIEYIFNSLGAHRISAVTDADNVAAKALFLRLGFRQEAHHIEHIKFKGAWGSECVFALLQREWLTDQK